MNFKPSIIVKTFRVKNRSILPIIPILVPIAFSVGLFAAMLLCGYIGSIQGKLYGQGLELFLWLVGFVILVVGLIVGLIFLVYKLGTYLKVSSDGLEYHRFPFSTIACSWNDAERISRGQYLGLSIATLLIPRQEPGMEIPLGGVTLGNARYRGVPLQDFEGFPDGELADQLRLYAPKLFEE